MLNVSCFSKKGGTDLTRSLLAVPTVTLNLRLLEEVLYDLPPLEGVFLQWHNHGVTTTTAGIHSLFARRKQLLGATTLSGASIQLLYECATDSLRSLRVLERHTPWGMRPLHARLLRHGPSVSAASTQALLPPGVLVQKTVSMTVGEASLLYTGVGLRRVTRQHLRAIAAALALPGRTIKRCTINPIHSNPVESCDMWPGMVSPFLHPARSAHITALVLSPVPPQHEAREVAISLSLWESLLLPLSCLRPLIRSYARRAYPAVQIIELESEESLFGYAEDIPC
jgi:hypothetical protein